jgi:hypothetical protein
MGSKRICPELYWLEELDQAVGEIATVRAPLFSVSYFFLQLL